jgi:hypothetical protein
VAGACRVACSVGWVSSYMVTAVEDTPFVEAEDTHFVAEGVLGSVHKVVVASFCKVVVVPL